jgi:hypothetical protein
MRRSAGFFDATGVSAGALVLAISAACINAFLGLQFRNASSGGFCTRTSTLDGFGVSYHSHPIELLRSEQRAYRACDSRHVSSRLG